MRLASFSYDGRSTWGIVQDDGVVDVGERFAGRWPTLTVFLTHGSVADLDEALGNGHVDVACDEVQFRPVVPSPGKILCVGLNFEEHRIETGRPRTEHPMIFTRFADTQVGHGEPLILPSASDRLDYEGELAIVIGKRARNVNPSDAPAHIAGYAPYNDASVRDFQNHTSQFTPGKNFPGTGGFGPWLVTADEIADYRSLRLVTRVNGQAVQKSGLDDLTFSIEEIVAYCSTWTELRPGDVIATGTPGGIGSRRDPPLWLKSGDVVEVEISDVGTLTNPVASEAGGS